MTHQRQEIPVARISKLQWRFTGHVGNILWQKLGTTPQSFSGGHTYSSKHIGLLEFWTLRIRTTADFICMKNPRRSISRRVVCFNGYGGMQPSQVRLIPTHSGLSHFRDIIQNLMLMLQYHPQQVFTGHHSQRL